MQISDISKALIHLLILNGQKVVSKTKIEEIFDYIFINFFNTVIKEESIGFLIDIESKRIKKELFKSMNSNFDKYISLGELKRDLKEIIMVKLSKLDNPVLRINFKNIRSVKGKFNYRLLLTVYKYFLGIDFD